MRTGGTGKKRATAAWARSADVPLTCCPPLHHPSTQDSSHDVQREATWALCSICTQGNDDHRLYVISQEGLVPMLAILTPELVSAVQCGQDSP